MNLQDMTGMAFANLWRTRLRSSLTILGVVIGIGALTSMVSFGTGMQKNFQEAFEENDLFTSMIVTPGKLNMEEMMEGDISAVAGMMNETPEALSDSVLTAIRNIENVEIAFPDESFAAKIRMGEREIQKNVQPLPHVRPG